MKNQIGMRRQQLGLSLVELMVALLLGLVLMTGIIQVFLASRQTYNTNEAMARMQENGRFALEFISRSARLAGYAEPIFTGDSPLPILPYATNPPPNNSECAKQLRGHLPTAPPCSTNGNGNGSDSIGFILRPPVIDGARRDCIGNNLDDPGTPAKLIDANDLIINEFSVSTNNGESSLSCRTYAYDSITGNGKWTAGPGFQPLIDGIDRMQILYGISTEGDSRSANEYVSADRVGDALSDWQKVRSVRISVLANSQVTTDLTPASRQFVLLDASPLTAGDLNNDRRSRQIFTTTIQLKNTD